VVRSGSSEELAPSRLSRLGRAIASGTPADLCLALEGCTPDDLEHPCDHCWTPVALAIHFGRTSCLQLLLERGANPTAYFHRVLDHGIVNALTPLQYAELQLEYECMRMLQKAEAFRSVYELEQAFVRKCRDRDPSKRPLLAREFVREVVESPSAKRLVEYWKLGLRDRWRRAGMDRGLLYRFDCFLELEKELLGTSNDRDLVVLRDFYRALLLGDGEEPSKDERAVNKTTRTLWDAFKKAGLPSRTLAQDLFECHWGQPDLWQRVDAINKREGAAPGTLSWEALHFGVARMVLLDKMAPTLDMPHCGPESHRCALLSSSSSIDHGPLDVSSALASAATKFSQDKLFAPLTFMLLLGALFVTSAFPLRTSLTLLAALLTALASYLFHVVKGSPVPMMLRAARVPRLRPLVDAEKCRQAADRLLADATAATQRGLGPAAERVLDEDADVAGSLRAVWRLRQAAARLLSAPWERAKSQLMPALPWMLQQTGLLEQTGLLVKERARGQMIEPKAPTVRIFSPAHTLLCPPCTTILTVEALFQVVASVSGLADFFLVLVQRDSRRQLSRLCALCHEQNYQLLQLAPDGIVNVVVHPPASLRHLTLSGPPTHVCGDHE
jgi:hypothetical protein